jgi:hypothetical protein
MAGESIILGLGTVWLYTTLVLEFQIRINELTRATVVKFIPVHFDRDEEA